ncbi:1-acyl-sn-glycerol-3-phosphate acyltransferase [Granulosicoccus sp. 3-233]|uniref:1-acyl-sn-glycerol-3-phosphate acyltransferase n=1 Tax=Granulosicoccus sp. 3-233 TaxID=3417969 RepID=UPI003D348E06
MNTSVELPLWSVLLGLLLATLWLLQHFLLPSARWILRRRANRLIDEVNTRLALQIPSFKLTRRSVLVDRLTFHPRVVELVDRMAQSEDIPREALMRKAGIYAREIVPAFNALLYFKAAYFIARHVVHSLYRVRLGFADDDALQRLPAGSSVVFLMNHRSNMDYILATYLAAEKTALSYAVGEWARIWPLQQLIRAMGGYFVRRDSGNALYRRVLECYVQMAADGGVPQAVFPEGRLSRDGQLGPARLGLLGYMTRGFDPDSGRDIVFIPVGINYDRVIEDRSLLRDAEKLPRRNLGDSLGILLRYSSRLLWQAVRGRRFRNGYACVNFGQPVSLRDWMRVRHLKAGELEDVGPLAEALMSRIGDITPILPVALVTTLFARAPEQTFTDMELKAQVLALLNSLEQRGHRAYIPRSDYHYAVDVGVRMLTLRGILLEEDGIYRAAETEQRIIRYYANSIAHLLRDEPVTEAGASETS